MKHNLSNRNIAQHNKLDRVFYKLQTVHVAVPDTATNILESTKIGFKVKGQGQMSAVLFL